MTKFLATRRSGAGRIYPMGLIFASILLLTIPGMFYNNDQASGLAPVFNLGCHGPFAPGVNPDFTCQNTNPSGCQGAPTQCTLSGTTISLLNGNSPFTQLIQGNIFALFSPLSSNGNGNRGPFDANGGGAYYTADCYVTGITGGAPQNITTNSFASHINTCTATNPDGSNMTEYFNTPSGQTQFRPFIMQDWNYNLLAAAQKSIPFYHIWNNATYALTCYNQGYWFITNNPTVGYATEGCDYYKAAGYSPPQNPNVNPVYSFLIGVPCSLGLNGCKSQTFPTGNTHMEIFIQPENWDTQFCTNAYTVVTAAQAQWYGSQQCTNMETWFTSPHGSATFNFGFFTPFLTILLGLVLFLIGAGINLRAGGSIFGSGTTFGVGTNRQGTKLAQVMGIGILAFSFLYSEFSPWFTSGILPNGLDGTLGFVSICVGGMLWGGLFWMATQD